MKEIFAPSWAISLLTLTLLLLAQECSAKTFVIKGSVKTESGKAVKGATLIFYEYVGRLARMPDVKIRAVRVTDRDGAYSLELDDVDGDIDVQLIRDRCEWKDETVRLPLATLKENGNAILNIAPRDDQCDCVKRGRLGW